MGVHLNPLALGLASAAAFLLSGVYYGLLGGRLARLAPVYAEAGPMAPATILLELLRTVAVALVVAGLVGWSGRRAGPGAAARRRAVGGLPDCAAVRVGPARAVPVILAAIHSGTGCSS